MVNKNIMNLISLGIHIFPTPIKFPLCFGPALLFGEAGGEGAPPFVECQAGLHRALYIIRAFCPPGSSVLLGSSFPLPRARAHSQGVSLLYLGSGSRPGAGICTLSWLPPATGPAPPPIEFSLVNEMKWPPVVPEPGLTRLGVSCALTAVSRPTCSLTPAPTFPRVPPHVEEHQPR